MDFNTNLALPNIDFGTFHLYPIGWGETPTTAWGVQWIKDHGAVQKSLGKPVIMEEFGITGTDAAKATTYKVRVDVARQWRRGSELEG